jgi:hypothetical protein
MESEYGNWVSAKLIYGSIALTIPFVALSFVFPAFVDGAIPFVLSFAYFAYARYVFSQRRGNLQRQERAHQGSLESLESGQERGCLRFSGSVPSQRERETIVE